ncbi:sulfite oxidase [Cryptosporangium phraense]|uniref:Sulfite oxidase n=1 Tax=Cryptosporangium phraense TaxID=2593070 RepID=A0A545B225_9ACTN|nr:sulfite oxidase [Cryptosporangium phraense]TQS46895.1 sulfite oxidase [Cryptosporangium phraense]
MIHDEHAYDRARVTQWLGAGHSRRSFLRHTATAGLIAATGVTAGGGRVSAAAETPPTIVKPTPESLFYLRGTNAEMRWEAMRGQGYTVPVDRFFVRNHTRTPLIDVDGWRLRLFGTGLRGAPTAAAPIEFTYRQLRSLPATTRLAVIECAGNGRSFFDTQQDQPATGTAWRLGAIGVAEWRGVRLSTVLRHAGLTPQAVDVMPEGLDPDYVSNGTNLGRVRRPMPIEKALHDVLLAYEMNGRPLPPDHGFPVRVVAPSWVGISSIKWLGHIEVSATPLLSPWNTQFYRLWGPSYPEDGVVLGRQTIKSAFELAWDERFALGSSYTLHGRSWSGHGPIRRVEVSTDGATWRPAHLSGRPQRDGWQRWHLPWRPAAAGPHTLRARASDTTGHTQPDTTPFNTQGYLFDAVVDHPVTVS